VPLRVAGDARTNAVTDICLQLLPARRLGCGRTSRTTLLFVLFTGRGRSFNAWASGRAAWCHYVADSGRRKPRARPPGSCWSGTWPIRRVGRMQCCAVALVQRGHRFRHGFASIWSLPIITAPVCLLPHRAQRNLRWSRGTSLRPPSTMAC